MKDKSLKFLSTSLAASLVLMATAGVAVNANATSLEDGFESNVPKKIKDAGGNASMGSGLQLNADNGNIKPAKMKAAEAATVNPAGPLGVDVASHQHNEKEGITIDWSAVAADNVEFAFIKASEGDYYQNNFFANDYQNSGENNLVRGAYHFANPGSKIGTDTDEEIIQGVNNINTAVSATKEAKYFVDAMNREDVNFYDGKTLPPVLDLEGSAYDSNTANPDGIPLGKCYFHTPEQLQAWATTFLNSVETQTGIRPIIYSGKDFWENCLNNYQGFSGNTQLWIASWGLTELKPENMFGGWGPDNYKYWQFTSKGKVKGIAIEVDLNVFNGTSDQLREQAKRTAPITPPNFVTKQLTNATVGQPYSQTISVQNSNSLKVAPQTPLPAGLALENKTIVGTPTVAATSKITLIASNSIGETNQDFTITVLDEPTVIDKPTFSAELSKPFTVKVGEEIFIPIKTENTKTVALKTGSSLPDGLQLYADDINNVHISGILQNYNTKSSTLVATNTQNTTTEQEIVFNFSNTEQEFTTINLNANEKDKNENNLANTGTNTNILLTTITLMLALGTITIYLSNRNKKSI